MSKDLRNWIASFVLVAAIVFASYEWIDRPIAFFFHEHFSQNSIFIWLQRIPKLFSALAILAVVAIGFLALAKKHASKVQGVMFLCSLSVIVADALTDQLKFIFGRTWPETWMQDNPSLIRDGIYGFNPLHGGAAFASFPSGHATVTCAVMSVLWIRYPHFRPVYGLCVLAVSIGLIGADYHFLSDIIAGGFIGTSTGWMAFRISETASSILIRPS